MAVGFAGGRRVTRAEEFEQLRLPQFSNAIGSSAI